MARIPLGGPIYSPPDPKSIHYNASKTITMPRTADGPANVHDDAPTKPNEPPTSATRTRSVSGRPILEIPRTNEGADNENAEGVIHTAVEHAVVRISSKDSEPPRIVQNEPTSLLPVSTMSSVTRKISVNMKVKKVKAVLLGKLNKK